MRGALLALALLGCASGPADGQRPAYAPAPEPGDAAVAEDAGIAARELAWLVAHLADDPDVTHARENESVRRLSAMGPEALRATAEVFRVHDERRIPFARRVFERALARRCRQDQARVTRTLRALQGVETGPDAGDVPRWVDRAGPWSNEVMEGVYAWVGAGARCAE